MRFENVSCVCHSHTEEKKRLNMRLVLLPFSTFAQTHSHLINIFIWVLASLFDPAHKDVVSACCQSFSGVESTSVQPVNSLLSKSNKAEAKCIALGTKDLTRVAGTGSSSPSHAYRWKTWSWGDLPRRTEKSKHGRERKTVSKIERSSCTINSWSNTANRAFLCRGRTSVKDMELFALPAKKGCPT